VSAGPFVPADAGTYIGDLLEFQMSVSSAATGNRQLPTENYVLATDEV
jgi:hypothetical protein